MHPKIAEEILARLIEAVEVIAIIGKGDGPRSIITAWPEYKRKLSRRRRACTALEVDRAEEAMTWWALIDDPDSRRALQFQVMCAAGGGKFTQVCKKFGWERSTVLKRNKVVLENLSKKLILGSKSRQAA
ncbi:MAG: DUF6362 family protein [Roseibium album]|uniref:hypothetical protein n=1 Tax=Roseibium album TaxID=311410 RepID=UPI0032F05CF8